MYGTSKELREEVWGYVCYVRGGYRKQWQSGGAIIMQEGKKKERKKERKKDRNKPL